MSCIENGKINEGKFKTDFLEFMKEPIQKGVVGEGVNTYFANDHFSRFVEGALAIYQNVEIRPDMRMAEFGSCVPFHLLPFKDMIPEGFIVVRDMAITRPYQKENVFFQYCNLNMDDLGSEKYDVITLCEVLEHLPSSMTEVRDRAIRSLKPNGYLLASYPCGGMCANLDGYSIDLVKEKGLDKYENRSPHLREFTEELAKKFINLPVIQEKMTHPPAYRNIYQILYRKAI